MAIQRVELIHTPDYEQIKKNFLDELTLAAAGKPSSISYLKHQLPQHSLLTQGIAQGIVIGGTNYIIQTIEIKPDGQKKFLKKRTGILPIFETKQTLLDFFARHLDERAEAIGINFGFPMKAHTGSDGEIDGKLLYSTKEHSFTGLTEPIGGLVKSLFQEKYLRLPKVSIANDTICLTLAGNGTENGALIAGTGINIGLAIHKNNQKVLLNLEAGNFNKFEPSEALKQIDVESENPGVHIFEKIVSGKYLAIYFNQRIKKNHPEIAPIKTSQDLSELSHTNHTDLAGDLARAIITRSAYLVAAAIAATYEFSLIQHSVLHSSTFTLIGEGSLLWNGWHYQENIQKQLNKLGIPEGKITIKHIKDSSINGAIGLITK
jgi:hexokinase